MKSELGVGEEVGGGEVTLMSLTWFVLPEAGLKLRKKTLVCVYLQSKVETIEDKMIQIFSEQMRVFKQLASEKLSSLNLLRQ